VYSTNREFFYQFTYLENVHYECVDNVHLTGIYTVSQKKACHYIFCNNLNNECPIIIIFGTLINENMCHRMVVSFPTSSI